MAVAGKVAITLSTENGGSWSADVTYDRLVSVKHNNNLYISRKTVANVEPPNDEFWFLALEGFGGEDVEALIDRLNELNELVQAIIDGTTQVGNAKTLDGHGAEYFAKASELLNYLSLLTGGTIKGNVKIEKEDASEVRYELKNANKNISLVIGPDGSYGIYEVGRGWLMLADANGNRYFEGTASGNIKYTDKPTGTYTGNGSAEQRTINTGGIGDLCIVYSYKGLCIVTPKGGALFEGQYRWLAGITFYNGVLTLATDDVFVNESGTGFSYLVP